jgi:ParB family transcriptional regulator, chromosome partitioning protein
MSLKNQTDKNFGRKISKPPHDPLFGKDEKDLTKTSTSQTTPDNQFLSLEQIKLPEKQPRRHFDFHAHEELVSSVRQHGILQPLIVRIIDEEKYELVAGERRLRAAKEVGLTDVPVVIKELDDETAFLLAVIENIQRENLNIVEESAGIVQILAIKLGCDIGDVPRILHSIQQQRKDAAAVKGAYKDISNPNNVIGTTEDKEAQTPNNVIGNIKGDNQQQFDNSNPQFQIIEEVFKTLGKKLTWESFTCNRLPILNFPQEVLDKVSSKQIEYTKGNLISKISDEAMRKKTLELAIENKWSLSKIKEHICSLNLLDKPQKDQNSYKSQFTNIMAKLKKTKIWDDPNKTEEIKTLLDQIQKLIGDNGDDDSDNNQQVAV